MNKLFKTLLIILLGAFVIYIFYSATNLAPKF